MRIEKKHKIYAGLVGTALAAWAIDAMFLRPVAPAPETAAAAQVPQPSADLAHPAIASKSDSTTTDKWLAERLTAWSSHNPPDSNRGRDVFSAPASWGKQLAAPSTQPTNTSAMVFKRDHHITAAMLDPRGGSILIDGRMVRAGQSIGGCRLVSVSQGRADFLASDGEQFSMAVGAETPGRGQ
jgi:hypothetical protein